MPVTYNRVDEYVYSSVRFKNQPLQDLNKGDLVLTVCLTLVHSLVNIRSDKE